MMVRSINWWRRKCIPRLAISKCTGLTIDILERGANFEDLSHAAVTLVTDNLAKRLVRSCRG